MIIQEKNELFRSDYIGKRRALCLDYGDKRIGVAVSDIGWDIASPLIVLESNGVFQKLSKILNDYSIGIIIVGAPHSLSGANSGKQYEKVKKFTEKLEKIENNIDILYWDERLSSVAATRILVEAEMTHSNKKKNIDKIAASFILQGFLDYMRYKDKPLI